MRFKPAVFLHSKSYWCSFRVNSREALKELQESGKLQRLSTIKAERVRRLLYGFMGPFHLLRARVCVCGGGVCANEKERTQDFYGFMTFYDSL